MWRGIIADVASVLCTPLTEVEDMEWPEILEYHKHALRLHRARHT